MRQRCAQSLGLVVLCAAAFAQSDGIGDPTFPTLGNKGYQAKHYTLRIQYDPSSNLLKGDVTMDAVADSDLSQFSVDFSGLTISQVKLDGAAVQYERTPAKLRIRPAKPLPAGARFSLETIYAGTPEQKQSKALPPGITSGWISYSGGAVAVCEPELAHTWFPCNDHPLNKATFDIEVTVPKPFTSAANGHPAMPGIPGALRFVLDKPAMTCMATVAVGRFVLLSQKGPANLPITEYLPAGEEATYGKPLSIIPRFMKYLEDRIGPYPYDTYGVIVLPQAVKQVNQLMAGSAIETTTIPVFGPDAATSQEDICHELTHQWMGDCVSVTNWGDDIWWVEGFAQFSEWLLDELLHGKAAYDTLVSSAREQNSAPGRWLKPGHLTAAQMFGSQSYVGGALTFAALRKRLGDDKFFETVKQFLAKNRYGNASVKDWIEVATKVAGKDMKPFFDAWLSGSTEPPMN